MAYKMPAELQGSILEKIVSVKLREVAMLRRKFPESVIVPVIERSPVPRSLKSALLGTSPAVMAEIKKASPSAGVLRTDFQALAIAREFERAGAAAISVLTEVHFFQGGLETLASLRWNVGRPLLRKDFIVEPYQLWESRYFGADCVLLIAALFAGKGLRGMVSSAQSLGMETLVEVHDEADLERALDAGPTLIGVNNRNLRSFEVSLDVSLRLAPKIPREIPAVAESGIRTGEDLRRLMDAGFRGFLIGEAFMMAPSPGAALSGLLAEVRQGGKG